MSYIEGAFHRTGISSIAIVKSTFDLRLRQGRQAVRTSLLFEGGVLASLSTSFVASSVVEAVALSLRCSDVSDIDNQVRG